MFKSYGTTCHIKFLSYMVRFHKSAFFGKLLLNRAFAEKDFF